MEKKHFKNFTARMVRHNITLCLFVILGAGLLLLTACSGSGQGPSSAASGQIQLPPDIPPPPPKEALMPSAMEVPLMPVLKQTAVDSEAPDIAPKLPESKANEDTKTGAEEPEKLLLPETTPSAN